MSSCDEKHSPQSKQITRLARSDHNFSVNVYGYIQFFFVRMQDRREHTAVKKPVTLSVYI